MKALYGIIIALAVACGREPTTPPPPPPPPDTTSVSLRASLQGDILFLPPWRADSMHVLVGDSTLYAAAGQQGRCVVWSSLPDNSKVYWTLFVSDTTSGTIDSLWATTFNFPTPQTRHAWAVIEELNGPGKGVFAVVRSVSGKCSTNVAG